eukprot:PhM_4_TR9391/c0_g1_i1/m.65205
MSQPQSPTETSPTTAEAPATTTADPAKQQPTTEQPSEAQESQSSETQQQQPAANQSNDDDNNSNQFGLPSVGANNTSSQPPQEEQGPNPLPHEVFSVLEQMLQEARQHSERCNTLTNSVRSIAEPYRVLVQQLIAERDECRQQLAHIHRVVSRYAAVQDPVVASDGFTYEKRVLQQYLDDCRNAQQTAISQQTKEVLQDTLYPNESLKKFVELLKDLKMPTQTPLTTVPGSLGHDDTPAAHPGPRGGHKHTPTTAQPGVTPTRHPCVRIYGLCNFGDDCVYASYPYEACLNYLKGKCRFGARCQEAHVDSQTGQVTYPAGGGAGATAGGVRKLPVMMPQQQQQQMQPMQQQQQQRWK